MPSGLIYEIAKIMGFWVIKIKVGKNTLTTLTFSLKSVHFPSLVN